MRARPVPLGARLCDHLLCPREAAFLDNTDDLRLHFTEPLRAVRPAAPGPPPGSQRGLMLASPVGGHSDSDSSDDEFHDTEDGFDRDLPRDEMVALARLHRDITRLPPAQVRN